MTQRHATESPGAEKSHPFISSFVLDERNTHWKRGTQGLGNTHTQSTDDRMIETYTVSHLFTTEEVV